MSFLRDKYELYKFRNLTLKAKLIIVFIGFMLFPLILTSIFLYNNSIKSMSNEESSSVYQTLELIANHVDLTLGMYESKTVEYLRNEYVFKTILGQGKRLTAKQIVDVDESLRQLCAGNRYIESAYLFTPDGQRSFYDPYYAGKFSDYFYKNENLEVEISNRSGRVYWLPDVMEITYNNPDISKRYFFSFGRVVRNIFSQLDKAGVLVININTNLLADVCSGVDISKGGVILVTDFENNILWHNVSSLIGKNIDNYSFIHKVEKDAPYKFNDLIDEKQYNVISYISDHNGFKYIALIPQADINDKMESFQISVIIIIIFSIILYTLGVVILDRYISLPIKRMIVKMDHIRRGDLKVTLEWQGNDEIGILYNGFNEMNNSIVKLIDEITISRQNEKEQEIKALHAQLNPHFLYNTLDTVSWMAREGQVSEVSKMLVSLSRILKYSISRKRRFVTFEEEILWVKNYIFIQMNRFENKFSIEYHVDDGVLNYKCLPLIFQPFIENAVLHGFKEINSGGRILLKAYELKKSIVTIISDNGCGMNQEQVEQLRLSLGQGIGIYNIRQQISLNFGLGSNIKIFSQPGTGTTIVIKIPKVE